MQVVDLVGNMFNKMQTAANGGREYFGFRLHSAQVPHAKSSQQSDSDFQQSSLNHPCPISKTS